MDVPLSPATSKAERVERISGLIECTPLPVTLLLLAYLLATHKLFNLVRSLALWLSGTVYRYVKLINCFELSRFVRVYDYCTDCVCTGTALAQALVGWLVTLTSLS